MASTRQRTGCSVVVLLVLVYVWVSRARNERSDISGICTSIILLCTVLVVLVVYVSSKQGSGVGGGLRIQYGTYGEISEIPASTQVNRYYTYEYFDVLE